MRWDARKMAEPMPVRSKVPPKWVDRYAFMESLPKGLTVAELGVYHGNFSEELLKRMQPFVDHMIDVWEPYGIPRIKPLESQEIWDGYYGKVCSRFRKQTDAGIAEIHRCTFREALPMFRDCHFDFIHHDGDHTEDHVYETLNEWWPKLKSGAYWMGHDFAVVIDNGVIPAVIRFLRENPEVGFCGITRADYSPSYVLRKP